MTDEADADPGGGRRDGWGDNGGPELGRSLSSLRGRLAWTSVLLSIALVIISLALVDAGQVLRQLETVDSRWALLAFVVHVLQVCVLGLRYSVIARGMGQTLTWLNASTEYALSVLLNQILPSGVLGDGVRALRLAGRAPDRGLFRSLEIVALDRVSGQLALCFAVLVTVPFSAQAELVERSTLLALVAGVLVLGGLLWLSIYIVPRWRRFFAPVRRFLAEAGRVLLHPASAAAHLSLSCLLIGLTLLQLYIAGRAVGVELGVLDLFWVGPLILLAMSVPTFFGGWGIREGASAILFAAAGMAGSSGVAVSLVYGVFGLIIALPGAVVLLLDPGRVSRPHARWGSAHALSVVIAWGWALHSGMPEVLAGVACLSFLVLAIQSRQRWTASGRFGSANLVTTARLLLVVFLLLRYEQLGRWTTAWCALFVLCLDGIDGWLARRWGQESEFGACYDVEVDTLFVVTLSYVLWGRGLAGLWVMLPAAWRYLYVLLPLVMATPRRQLRRTRWGRWAFVFMTSAFMLALIAPARWAQVLAALGTLVISLSFAWSFWLHYGERPRPS